MLWAWSCAAGSRAVSKQPALSKVTALDLQSLMVGKKLGEGIARKVYEFLPDPDYVIKIEDRARSFQNIEEYHFWNDNRYDKSVAKWLAPIHSISPSGTVLLMKRIQPVALKELPDKIPQWLDDVKVEHFGRLDGKIVVCDYAFTRSELPRRLINNRAKK